MFPLVGTAFALINMGSAAKAELIGNDPVSSKHPIQEPKPLTADERAAILQRLKREGKLQHFETTFNKVQAQKPISGASPLIRTTAPDVKFSGVGNSSIFSLHSSNPLRTGSSLQPTTAFGLVNQGAVTSSITNTVSVRLSTPLLSFPTMGQGATNLSLPVIGASGHLTPPSVLALAGNPVLPELATFKLNNSVPLSDASLVSTRNPSLLLGLSLAETYIDLQDPRAGAELDKFIAAVQAAPDIHTSIKANMLVEAARALGQIGETDKAQKAYAEVPQYGYGWATGMALLDRAIILMAQNKHEEARALLMTPVTGLYADQIKVPMLNRLSHSYYATGEIDKARQSADEAIALAKTLTFLPREGLESQVEAAQTVLDWSDFWDKTPLVIDPKEVRFFVGGEPSLILGIETQATVPLTAVSDREDVTVGAVPPALTVGEYSVHQGLIVQIAPESMQPGFKCTITVTSEQLPGVEMKIPVTVEPAKLDVPTL